LTILISDAEYGFVAKFDLKHALHFDAKYALKCAACLWLMCDTYAYAASTTNSE